MRSGRHGTLKLDVPSLELLRQLVGDPLPLGLSAAPPKRSLHRDIYLDTASRALERLGMRCRFRLGTDDQRFLRVTLREATGGGTLVAWKSFEATVDVVDPEQALAGLSEPARRLRGVIEPKQLVPILELQTERWTRVVRSGLLRRPTFEIAYDAVTAPRSGFAPTFQEIAVKQRAQGAVGPAQLVQALQHQYGLQPLVASKLERAQAVLRGDAPVAEWSGKREVAIIALVEGRIALRSGAGSLELPTGQGGGEEACRAVVAGCFGSGEAPVFLLGTVPGGHGGPLTEIWLARRSATGLVSASEAGLEWLLLDEVVARVGSPALRDPRTLSALNIAASVNFLIERPRSGALEPSHLSTAEEEQTLSGIREPLPRSVLDPSRSAPEQFINADLSLLEFNTRVLELAEDATVPLLARLRFLSIFSTNLDEFFMVRVGALKHAVAEGSRERSLDGLSPQQQVDAIAIRLRPLIARQQACFVRCLLELATRGIRIVPWEQLDEGWRAHVRAYFESQVFPVLVPHAITQAPGHPFPHIPNLSLSLGVAVRDSERGPLHFGYLKLPPTTPRLVPLPNSHDFVALEDVIRANLGLVYRGRRVVDAHCFRITRSGDLEIDEQGAADLLEAVAEEVRKRPFAAVVRMEVARSMPQEMRNLLQRELRFEDPGQVSTLAASDVYEIDGLMHLGDLRQLASLPMADLQYPPFRGGSPVPADRSIFDVVAEGDVLVHHPYDSFESSVQRLLADAAQDPSVLSIRMTLYRTGDQSPIVDALIGAAAAGKEVDVFVELKARFDEERNIEWAKKLEHAGIHVVYGLVELKTHAKVALVVRREREGIQRYVHVGTGNYNAATAAAYTDLGLLSSRADLAADINDLFNELTGSSRPPQSPYRKILVAPTHMLRRFVELVERETEHAKAGRGGRIRVKLNGLGDEALIAALYRASQAGVEIDLIIRGICCLRPGVPGLSDRIRVLSVLGRFLEHSRIYHFANGGNAEYYIGSADWRSRNLRRRIEVVAPVEDPECRRQLDQLLELQLKDPRAWELRPDGCYLRRAGPSSGTVGDSQAELMARHSPAAT